MSNGEADLNRYVLAHGKTGRERLRVLARIMEEGTTHLFKVAGVSPGMTCLDVGCGGGDVSQLLARRVGQNKIVDPRSQQPVLIGCLCVMRWVASNRSMVGFSTLGLNYAGLRLATLAMRDSRGLS